jgi:cytoskeletal protein RodZ
MLQKFNKMRSRRGQSTLEYAILIVIVIGALIAIQFYIKRGVQGRFKSSTDDIGDQFSPGNTDYNKVVTTSSRTLDTFQSGVTSTESLDADSTLTTVDSVIINAAQEYFGGPAVP